jgi:thiamine pyrophosphate-dependent acetolactate synthase large subunit-like protein
MTLNRERAETYPLSRREVVAQILAGRDDLLVVGGLGAPVSDITLQGDNPLNFPLWGAMGGAVPMGLGLALAQPYRRVLVVTGDGEMLMGIGSLGTVAAQAPDNLAIVVLDNERYGETGMQTTHTAATVDLAGIAAASGIDKALTVRKQAEMADAVEAIRKAPGPVFVNVKVRAESLGMVLPPKEGAHLKDRFRLALLGPRAVS